MYLLDTCVISDLSPQRSQPDRSIAEWLQRNEHRCFLSVITMTEIAYGVAWLRHRRATTKAARLAAWYDELVHRHADRIIPIDTDIAFRAGVLLSRARAAGMEPDAEDAWIAATASVRQMVVLTFNEVDFRPLGVAWRNPRVELPSDGD
ncbi:MAG TPA: type II toxin-antitoxin system VapC family toxin [Acetobacteraceae bacterium]